MVNIKKNEEALSAINIGAGLDNDRALLLKNNFTEYFRAAHEITEKAQGLIVNDESQVVEMQRAREFRFLLKDIRLRTEKKRKAMKEQALQEGRAIDGAANIIKALIFPVEKHLEFQENFKARKEQEKKEALQDQRYSLLSEYIGESARAHDLSNMTEAAFTSLLTLSRAGYEAAEKEKAQVEKDRLADIKAEEEKQAQVIIENERLKKEKEEKDQILESERAKLAATIAEAEKKAKEAAEKQAEILAEEKKKTEEERTKREAVEAKARAVEAEARAEREATEAKAKAEKLEKEELARKALLAPDREKLLAFADFLHSIEIPHMQNRSAGKIIDETTGRIQQIIDFLKEEAKSL